MQVTRYSNPSYSQSSSSSTSYDYSGQDEHIKRQDALGEMRDAKFGAFYDGDVKNSIGYGNKIRDLLKAVRAHSPFASERDPVQVVNPLVRVTSQSSSSNSSGDGGTVEGLLPESGTEPIMDDVAVRRPPPRGVDGNPNRVAGIA